MEPGHKEVHHQAGMNIELAWNEAEQESDVERLAEKQYPPSFRVQRQGVRAPLEAKVGHAD
jgi:hypothetical protein